MTDSRREETLGDVRTIVTLRLKKKGPTHSVVCQEVKQFLAYSLPDYTEEEFERIVSDVEYNIQITVEEPQVLMDKTTYTNWFSQAEPVTQKKYHERYERFLMGSGFAPAVIDRIKRNSYRILSLSANPLATKEKKRGLVVGEVQSGKTASYLSLINLACDFGYKIIVLLAGMTDVLREQTQERVDYGLIGALSNTINADVEYVGVGSEKNSVFAVPLTNKELDFKKFIKKNTNATPKEYSKPLILVVKKHSSVLTNVCNWLKKTKVQGKNLLLVDDEADSASINSNKDDNEPTKVNKAIRDLYAGFDVATYVGFTATPFANIFINPDDDENLKDLFPSDYIVQLKSPTNYCGSHWFFNDEEHNTHLRILDEEEADFLPVIHKLDTPFTGPSESLKESILVFLLGCAVRTLRGQKAKHRSMLINISRFNKQHGVIFNRVSAFVDELHNILEQETYKPLSAYLKHPLLKKMYDVYCEMSLFETARKKFDFESVRKEVRHEIDLFKIAVMNNKIPQKNRFSYDDYPDGARVIMIGGFVLSRGLTLEGLMVSYYSRNSAAYDSLLQMGRWFGYRPNYEDLCVLYISRINVQNFKAVIEAVDDLGKQLNDMIIQDKKPANYGLMVRESPDTLETALLVTSRNKMHHSTQIEYTLSYAGVVPDTSKIYKSIAENEKNEEACQQFVEDLFSSGWSFIEMGSRKVISKVPQKTIAEFIKKLSIHFENRKFDTDMLSSYIEKNEEFPEWDIVVATGSHQSMTWSIGGETFPAAIRECDVREEENFIRVGQGNNRLIDPGIFSTGLTEDEIEQLHAKKPEKALTYTDYLSVQDRRPLLVFYPLALKHKDVFINEKPYIGFAAGFPNKGGMEKVKYRANDIKMKGIALKDFALKDLARRLDIGDEND